MVYAALLAALAAADPRDGALLMGAFGLGTLPNLLAVSAWFRYVVRPARSRLARWFVAAVIAGVGVFGIAGAAGHATLASAGAWCASVAGLPAPSGQGR
jgi:sulfite exporter TauE/SafE